MNINLIYKEKNYQFDIPPEATIEYIKYLTSKISGKKSNLDLFYKNENLSKYIDKTLLKTIVPEGEKSLTINIKKKNYNNQSSKASTSISNTNYNNNNFFIIDNEQYYQQLKNRFLKFHKSYLNIYEEVSTFEKVLDDRFHKIIQLCKEFKKYIKVYDEKLGKYYNNSYHFFLQKIFNENCDSKNLSEKDINDIDIKLDECFSSFTHLEIENFYQKNIILYLQYKLEEFLKIKILIHQLNSKKEYEEIISNLDILFSELKKIQKYKPIDLLSEFHNIKKKTNNSLLDYQNYTIFNRRKINKKKKYNLSDIPPLIEINNDNNKIFYHQINNNNLPIKMPKINQLKNTNKISNFIPINKKDKPFLSDNDRLYINNSKGRINQIMFDYRKYKTLPNELINDKTNNKDNIQINYKDSNIDNYSDNIKLSKSLPYSNLNLLKKNSVEIENSNNYEKKKSILKSSKIINNENDLQKSFLSEPTISIKRNNKKKKTKKSENENINSKNEDNDEILNTYNSNNEEKQIKSRNYINLDSFNLEQNKEIECKTISENKENDKKLLKFLQNTESSEKNENLENNHKKEKIKPESYKNLVSKLKKSNLIRKITNRNNNALNKSDEINNKMENNSNLKIIKNEEKNFSESERKVFFSPNFKKSHSNLKKTNFIDEINKEEIHSLKHLFKKRKTNEINKKFLEKFSKEISSYKKKNSNKEIKANNENKLNKKNSNDKIKENINDKNNENNNQFDENSLEDKNNLQENIDNKKKKKKNLNKFDFII